MNTLLNYSIVYKIFNILFLYFYIYYMHNKLKTVYLYILQICIIMDVVHIKYLLL